MQITQQQALAAVAQQQNNICVTPAQVSALLAQTRGTTLAQVTQVTQVKTAAAYKALNIQKVTIANVTLANNLKAFTNVYVNKVQRTSSEPQKEFVASKTYFSHTDCYSVVKHNTKDVYYLYALYNSAKSVYLLNNTVISKQDVAQYLTASAAKTLLDNSKVVYNKTNNITHTATVRTPMLSSIVSIHANKQQLSV